MYLGVWMDHASAHLMEYSTEAIETIIISSDSGHPEKEHGFGRNENIMHNKEQHQLADYYKRLGDIIQNYQEVLLFGATDAKVELVNILKANHHFEKIKFEIKTTDKMTDNQQHAFVRDYFSKH